jgi:hypothetical protein
VRRENWQGIAGVLGLLAVVALFVGGFVGGLLWIPDDPPASDPPSAAADVQQPGPWAHPDAATLALWSEAARVPTFFTFAIAWRETRNNASPASRGKLGEVGRFQILPRTARTRCPKIDVREYEGNLACFLKMAGEDGARCRNDWRCAARIHNGSWAYADSVMADVRELVRRRIEQ